MDLSKSDEYQVNTDLAETRFELHIVFHQLLDS